MSNKHRHRKNAETVQQGMNIEELKQIVEGTDDLSMARGLIYALLATLTNTTQELSEVLYRGEKGAKGILSVILGNIDFIQHNTSIIRDMANNFEELCSEIREETA